MSYATYHLSKATDKQIRLIRYLESELDVSIRLSYETISLLSKAAAGQKIRDLYALWNKRVKEKQVALF